MLTRGYEFIFEWSTVLQAATILDAMASEKKYLATKILTEVANWCPTDYKRN